jgi:phosphohistidine phosphatase
MRELLFIRHGLAEDREIAAGKGLKDEDRALTKKGRQKMADAASGLKVIAPKLGYIATSPLLRAVQTAEIIRKEYRKIQLATTDVLRPGLDFHNFVNWARQLPEKQLTAMVGHEPDLSLLICRLLSGQEQSFIYFKKGGAALIELPENIEAGSGKLMWFLAPGQLRHLGAA